MKFNRIALLMLMVALVTCHAVAQNALELPQVSPRSGVEQRVGLTDVKVTYYRPLMKGREIFGVKTAASKPLVPYGEVWRTGANNATLISFTDDVKINGQTLPAGRYSLHSIPNANEWEIIFNKEAEQWGSFAYKKEQDALRVKARPVSSNTMREMMTIEFPEVTENRAVMEIAWANVRVPLTIEVDTTTKAVKMAREAVAKADAKDWRTPYQAANYAFQNKVAMPEAKAWLQRSLSAQETYQNLGLQARMLAAEGNKAAARTQAEKAINIGKAAKQPVDTSMMEKFLAEL